jgi:RNA polymerase sigma-70 factor (ECF subfamily)
LALDTRQPDDDVLMARTAQGEEAAFRLLVQRWENDVLAFLIHMLGSREEAEDLVQDTFIKVYRQAGRYRGEGRFRSWLLRIAGNLARSRLRRRRIR